MDGVRGVPIGGQAAAPQFIATAGRRGLSTTKLGLTNRSPEVPR
ncbi:MAG: hypothetical protein OEM67_00730 [Thermoleophilia bacterium]|nr:hypothetical protein [Thermoleophilia bacterium]MDH3725130.1 hypothetical protein [Thermoleophilia bacterium]